MNNKSNLPLLTMSVFLLVVITGLIVLEERSKEQTQQDIEFNGVVLRAQDYQNLQENFQYDTARVCSLDTGNCFLISKIPDNELNIEGEMEQDVTSVYVGPIPEGYDEEHFRDTGETKLLIDGKEI